MRPSPKLIAVGIDFIVRLKFYKRVKCCKCVAPRVRCGSDRVRCGSDSSAPACCTAGPGSNLGSAPQRRPSTERKAMRTRRVLLYE